MFGDVTIGLGAADSVLLLLLLCLLLLLHANKQVNRDGLSCSSDASAELHLLLHGMSAEVHGAPGAHCRAREGGFTHLIIEKPFGSDSKTFDELNKCTSSTFKESELFRIDHYLGARLSLSASSTGLFLCQPHLTERIFGCLLSGYSGAY